LGQTLSKLQDYSVYKLEINGDYQLSRLCFDTLSNQSMTFHNSRFGGSLVSQTSRFVSGYSGLVDVVTYSLWPTLASIVLTVGILAPIAPLFVAILVAMLVLYVVIAYGMYKAHPAPLGEASRAQNKLSGVLSDAVTNILAVKTYGREDYERGLFTTRGPRGNGGREPQHARDHAARLYHVGAHP
jgi:ATP-binding cassette subfamily B protein